MALLRLANDETKRIPLGESEDYIEVRADISKRTFNRLVASMPTVVGEGGLTVEQGLAFQTGLFEVFVVGWSLDIPATSENYLDLARAGAEAVDVAVAQHFEGLTPSKDDATKS